jgi:hypothetical protein
MEREGERCCRLWHDDTDDTPTKGRGTGENAAVEDAARRGAASSSDFIVFVIFFCDESSTFNFSRPAFSAFDGGEK